MEKKENKAEILKLEIEKLKLEIELEKVKHKEYWQSTVITGDYIPRPEEGCSWGSSEYGK